MEGDGGGETAAPVDVSPLLMDEALQRLRALRYEAGYCAPRDITPFHKLQFAVAGSNPSTQFAAFTGIVAWLITQAKRTFVVDRYEDPSTTCNKLLAELRAMRAGPDVLDVNPLKLRSAAGEAVCRILLFCAEAALAAQGFKWGRPLYPQDPPADVVEEEGDDDDTPGDEVIEEGGTAGSDGEGGADEDVLYVASSLGSGSAGSGSAAGSNTVLETAVDPVAWRAEVERVTPRLRPPVPLGGGGMLPGGGLGGGLGGGRLSGGTGGRLGGSALGEWRGHLESTLGAERTVGRLLPPATDSLRRLASELSELLATVAAREKSLNAAYAPLVADRAAAADRQAELGAAVAAAQGRVTGLTSELAGLTEALEEVTASTDERGSSMADASPLIRMKAALSALRTDIKDLGVQVGVLGHAAMQQRLAAREASVLSVRTQAAGARSGVIPGGRDAIASPASVGDRD